jgi:hypothetical protein
MNLDREYYLYCMKCEQYLNFLNSKEREVGFTFNEWLDGKRLKGVV